MTFLIIISISGEKLSAPRKLVTMMMFSFEVISEYKSYISQFSHSQVDTLEIALRDHLDIVDKVFLVEATKSHKGVSGTGIQFPNVL